MPGICDMEFLFPAVLYIVSFSSLIQSQQQSQSTCSYSIDQKGRKQVLCEQFRIDLGVSFNFNPNSFDLDTKVLIVTGSPSKPNQFNQTSNFNSTIFEEIHICYAPQWEIIGDDTFRLVSETLLVLNLTHNGLRSVNEGTFRNLSRLTHLHLDNNRIGFLPSSVFGYLTALRVLTLTKNLINNVEPRMGYQLGNLEVLDMSSNPIGSEILGGVEPTISQSFLTLFEDLPNLRILRLSDTGLKSLPWAVIQFRSPLLRELDFSGNQLENIGNDQFSLLRNISIIRIGNNPIRAIAPTAFAGLYKLVKLDLTGRRALNILQNWDYKASFRDRMPLPKYFFGRHIRSQSGSAGGYG